MIHNTEEKVERIEGEWMVTEVQQFKTDEWSAYVRYICLNENQKVDEYAVTYTGEEYNQWFSNYNSGTFLLQELVRLKGWNLNVPGAIESEFMN